MSVVLVLAGIACLGPILTADPSSPIPLPLFGTSRTGDAQQPEAAAARADVEELEHEEQEIAALIRESQSRDRSGARSLMWPLPNDATISSSFGQRLHPILKVWLLHAGIDIVAEEGTPIEAAGAGTVMALRELPAYGSLIIVDHGNRCSTVYAHLSSVLVSEGDSVSKGQVIGKVGRTGRVTGAHLHFEVRKNGAPLSPLTYVSPPR